MLAKVSTFTGYGPLMQHGFHKTDFIEQCLDHLYASEAVSITWDALRSTEHLYAYLQPEK